MEISIRKTNKKEYVFNTEDRVYINYVINADGERFVRNTWTEGEWFELQRQLCEKNNMYKNKNSLRKAELTAWEKNLQAREAYLNETIKALNLMGR